MRFAWNRPAILGIFALIVFDTTSLSALAQTVPAKPTVEEATKFINDAEQRLLDLGIKASRASWVAENFITDDTEQISADANEILNTASTNYAKEAHRFDQLELPPALARNR